MPQIFKIGSYRVYFWSNESDPLEPIHVHVSAGVPTENATKIWITRSGDCLLCHNKSQIARHELRTIMEILHARSKEICKKWYDTFGEIEYYC